MLVLTVVLRALRGPFLLLTLCCFVLVLSMVSYFNVTLPVTELVVVLVASLSAHVAVNTLNEYQDFTSGLDQLTRRTPFSGGSGALPEHPAGAPYVLFVAVFFLSLTTVAGLYLVARGDLVLLLLGALGLLIIVTYTRWINRYPWLCLLAPGTGFGFLMVSGSFYAVTMQVNLAVILTATMMFFLVNNLLLLNQFPDLEADRLVGRRHFPLRFGITGSRYVLVSFLLATFLTLITGVVLGILPVAATLALLALPAGFYALHGAARLGSRIGEQPKYLASNVAVVLLTPLLLALGFFLA